MDNLRGQDPSLDITSTELIPFSKALLLLFLVYPQIILIFVTTKNYGNTINIKQNNGKKKVTINNTRLHDYLSYPIDQKGATRGENT